ncbi:hypothetical protein BBO99_00000533 [Phytophthora kernoviae]|uniref:Piwi domain-containing protein n=1 Tax=Phytophthora kernoviae TaxID=325452 RepID=A0A421H2H8_9STRA|nr:hypothetical protein BBI17_000572 [Phytophthora kernoviae]RLN85434.1 hypothetical protein BBO99_00000533 [Phytophthora kernoviae]
MEAVGARVLEAPSVEYANEIVHPVMGAWNLVRKQFIHPATLSNWGVVICDKTEGCGACVRLHQVERFYSKLCREAQKCGMDVLNLRPVIVSSEDAPQATIEDLITECFERLERDSSSRWGPPQLVLVIKPDEDAGVYQDIKRVCHTVLGVPSQCITTQLMHRANAQIMASICLKINSKLGGLSSVLPEGMLPLVHDAPTIILGADVANPRLESSSHPPVSVVTASLDRYSSKYAARLAVQDGPNEFSHLPRMFWELFREYYKHSRCKPQHVVYFRSGVASSCLHDVVQAEMRALRKAFRMLEANYEPLVTFIMVNENHHVRLFVPEGSVRNSQDRSGNPVPGTIVDKGALVDPQRFDFFLVGHSSIQGTSVPTQYTLLVDENKLGPDKIEKLTYRLCYSYARCTRSVHGENSPAVAILSRHARVLVDGLVTVR